jgi:hypothetical protein
LRDADSDRDGFGVGGARSGSCRIKRRDEEALPACSSRSHIAQMLVGLDGAKSIERLATGIATLAGAAMNKCTVPILPYSRRASRIPSRTAEEYF